MRRNSERRARRRGARVLRWIAAGLTGASALSGCALLSGPIDRAAERTAAAVNLYCDNFTADQRVQFGDRVRQLAAPDSITVDCDP